MATRKKSTAKKPAQSKAAEGYVDRPTDAEQEVQPLSASEKKAIAKQAKEESKFDAETTSPSAAIPVGGSRGTSDVAAGANPDLPTVAGPDASADEREAAVRSQGPSGREVEQYKSKITIKSSGKTVTVPGNIERTRAKLSHNNVVSFQDDDGNVTTVDPSDVSKVESA